jgi:hypothetical protein
MTAMSKKTVLLIGGLTHTNKEWKEYSSKYTLKVCIEDVYAVQIPELTGIRNMKAAAGKTSCRDYETENTTMLWHSTGPTTPHQYVTD